MNPIDLLETQEVMDGTVVISERFRDRIVAMLRRPEFEAQQYIKRYTEKEIDLVKKSYQKWQLRAELISWAVGFGGGLLAGWLIW